VVAPFLRRRLGEVADWVFDRQSSGGQSGLGGLGRHEAGVRPPSAADPDLVASGGAFEVVAEVAAELVAADVDC
jgi:hypothetical protein